MDGRCIKSTQTVQLLLLDNHILNQFFCLQCRNSVRGKSMYCVSIVCLPIRLSYVKNRVADIWKIIGFSGVISPHPRKDFLSNTEIDECPEGNHWVDIF